MIPIKWKISFIFQTWKISKIRNPLHPFVGYPLISINSWTSHMTYSAIQVILSSNIEPVKSRTQFRFDTYTRLKKNCMASKFNFTQINHESDYSCSTKEYWFSCTFINYNGKLNFTGTVWKFSEIYMKAVSGILKVQNLPFWHIWRLWILTFINHQSHQNCKNSIFRTFAVSIIDLTWILSDSKML